MSGGGQEYLLTATFATQDDFVACIRRVTELGHRDLETYTPYPVEEAQSLIKSTKSPLPKIIFVATACGAAGGFFMQWYSMTQDYPYNIGMRPFNSWPAYLPITFELGVLTGALVGFIGVLIAGGLVRFHHPVMERRHFNRFSENLFHLEVRLPTQAEAEAISNLVGEHQPLETEVRPC